MLEQYITNDYLRALAILFVVFVGIRLLVYIIEKIVVVATRKTKTNLDDKLVERSSKPITSIAFLIGLRVALIELHLTENLSTIFSNVIYSFVILSVGFLVYGIVDVLFFASWAKFTAKTKSDLDDALSSLVNSLLKAILVIFTGLYILNLWGIEIGPFLAGLGIGGIAIAFALQASLSDIFGGVSMILDKTVRVGDMISLDDGTFGIVENVGIRSTKVKTFDNDIVIVPNSKLASGRIQNINQPEPKQRVVVPFGVAYGNDIEKVKKIVLAEVKKVKDFINDPEPKVRFLEMADSSLNFKAYFYVASFENKANALDEANTRIYNALNKNKIEIPFPQLDINLKK